MTTRWIIWQLGLLALTTTRIHANNQGGVIYYNSLESLTSPVILRRVNADGTGNQLLPINLPEPSFPVLSRDGTKLLLTSGDPGRPFKISRNVFGVDLVTGGMAKVTGYEDLVQNGAGQITILTNGVAAATNDSTFTSYTIHFPYHKAFAPDGRRVAVMDLPRTGGSTLSVSRTNAPTEQFLGSSRAPVLEIQVAENPSPIGATIYLGGARTGANQSGDGVDWHPFREEVVAPFRNDIPVTGNMGKVSSEGTQLFVFATDGRFDPFIRKLTNPSGVWDIFIDATTSFLVRYDENDYAPAISPDGTRVAYVRHTLRADSRISTYNLPAVCSIRVIHYDGTNDREVLRLVDGLWITTLAWSPDGTQIALDVSPQLFFQGAPLMTGDVTRSEIHVVGADGSNPHRFLAAPAAYPAWAPGNISVTAPAPILSLIPNGKTFDLRLLRLVPGRPIEIESSTDLRQWTLDQRFNAVADEQFMTLTLPKGTPNVFYRAVAR